ncbi:PDZ and LIM domain protein 5 [Trichinella zimbabwensis]|uniref:PDZ and LIM domain protein 5 n=1 Tax=Trichinella zimbabwensis TaxID=268475 RepID=A0A0V1H2C5_9BILA|nr:PDZ and LIM domain protein 5 [Trichinella zimbabwensis]
MENPKNCASCWERVTGKALMVDKKIYHENCFVCSKCSRPLDKYFRCNDFKNYCNFCYVQMHHPTCQRCMKVIKEGRCMFASKYCFHEKCYACTDCLNSLHLSRPFLVNQQLYCQKHWPNAQEMAERKKQKR